LEGCSPSKKIFGNSFRGPAAPHPPLGNNKSGAAWPPTHLRR
jgi:hypothetical protein